MSEDVSQDYNIPPKIQTPVLGALQSQLKHLSKTEYSFFDNLSRAIRNESCFDDIMKCFYCYIEGVFNQNELFDLIQPLFDKPTDDLYQTFKAIVASRDNSRRHHNLLCKPFSEFETHLFKKVSYSFFLMPDDFYRPLCRGRFVYPEIRQLCKEIFNEDYSSLPQGSESFKFKTKNQFEDALFKVEDDMYRIDFEIGNLMKTMQVLNDEKIRISNLSPAELEQFQIDEKKFNKIRLKQIEKMYETLGHEMLRLLPKRPLQAIPIIYDRFKLTVDKLISEKAGYLKNWREICEKNFHKSLDHRSFHFKQFEKKNQTQKNYLSEIKGLAQACVKGKTLNLLVGGCKDCEFYSTYSLFENIVVH
jgi:paired amphipathic helix protein Sin3a